MYSAEEAEKMGLIDQAVTDENLIPVATEKALELGKKHNPAFAGIKSLLRKPVVDIIKSRERNSIEEFVEIWYSGHTWENLKNIKIR
jgi:enoyl-CoA hydratase/carnithine racemase